MQKSTTTTSAATTSAAGSPAEAVDSDATTSMATEAAAEAATAAVSHSPSNSCERGDSSGPAVSNLCVCVCEIHSVWVYGCFSPARVCVTVEFINFLLKPTFFGKFIASNRSFG